MATGGESGDPNHCDPCFILDKIKVDSSSMCRECRHQLCDKCVEHHRRTLATRHHNIISFQHPGTSTTQVFEQQLKQGDQSGTKPKSGFRPTVRKSHVGTSKQPITAVGGQQHYSRVQRNTTDTQSHASGTQHRSDTLQYEVSGRRITGSDSVDQDQALTIRMKNMRLDAGTSNTQTTRQTGKPYTTATLKHSLNVERKRDKGNCDIRGLVVLQDKLIVCDCSNSKLKVYDSSYRFLCEYKYDYLPYDIDMLDVNTVVVSSELGRNMRLLSVGNESMKEISKINTDYECWGVCCYEGKIYCLVVGNKDSEWFSEVRVYARDGQLLHTFEHLSDGKVECDVLWYITVNPQTGILYVTDMHEGVLALSTSGDVMAVMSPRQLKIPHGIAVDDNGHIYVCGFGSNNVIQMSGDGQNVAEILSGEDKCKMPWCVKICGNKMFVSHEDPKSGDYKISVYQLS